MRSRLTLLLVLGVVGAWLAPSPAGAIPAFAKKFGYSCASCHNAWPMLNAFGRRFKENGYQVERGAELTEDSHVKAEDLSVYKYTPIAGRVKGYALDKKKGKVTKIRPLHEVELMVAGNAGEIASYWLEMEAEDEADWNVGIESGFVGVHPRDEINLALGYGPVFWVDPYQPLADGGRRFTRGHKPFANLGFSTGQRLRKGTPQLTGYGRFAKKVFWGAGVTTGTGDPEGEDEKDFMGRVAIDANDNIMVGGYVWAGQVEAEGGNLDYSRAGFDFQLQYDTWSVFGNYMRATDDTDITGASESNDVFSITGLYIVQKNKRPLFVPLVRIDSYSLEDGARDFTDATFDVTVYALANWNVTFEFWANVSTPSGVSKNHRSTLLFNVLF